ncbi:hypothetical protein TEA_005014 [Camellia sinensis var. sinensis]|uniref:Serine/threonine-protein kinase BSK1-like TPR repeats domain-containing protein n=1 Tax=Camellia sinensis var. sinensis TaxID=542762 RepID=A0A4S4F291_CAMSN|nr:hypothetical protein TEA_005014 [Camellia sinensis var. sinensis]
MASSPSGESRTSCLLNAALTGNLKLLTKLAEELDYGDGLAKTFMDVKDSGGQSALHFAAAGGKTHVCKYLVQELKLNVNLKDGIGDTPLNHATIGQHYQTAVFLVENGANPNMANDKGFIALHYAAEKGHKEFLRLLISKGAEVDAKSDSGTPLQCAAAKGRKEAVKILLDRNANAGANPNLGSRGQTPLTIAVCEGETEVIKCLLKAGANLNVTNLDGLTALELAALHGNHELVMMLLPRTSQIPTILDWSFAGIIKYVHSEEFRRQREQNRKESFLLSKSKGEEAFKRKDYMDAIFWYTQAITVDPLDATVLSNRSLCWARLNEGSPALSDAEACIMLRPDWAKAHYREGVAWRLLKNFPRAAEAFCDALKLDPDNEELQIAFREAVGAEFGIPVGKDLKIMRI